MRFFLCWFALEPCAKGIVCEYKIKRNGSASVDNHGLASIAFYLKLQKKTQVNENSWRYSHFEYFLEVLVKTEAKCFYVQNKFHFTEMAFIMHLYLEKGLTSLYYYFLLFSIIFNQYINTVYKHAHTFYLLRLKCITSDSESCSLQTVLYSFLHEISLEYN